MASDEEMHGFGGCLVFVGLVVLSSGFGALFGWPWALVAVGASVCVIGLLFCSVK